MLNLITKFQITKIVIVLGFFLSVTKYTNDLVSFYLDGIEIAYSIDDAENSDPVEKENPEKEDVKEKEKISQYNYDVTYTSSISAMRLYPEFNAYNSSVYLEYETPPPEFV